MTNLNESNQIPPEDEGVSPVNNTVNLEVMELCEDCKNKLVAAFIKAYHVNETMR